MILLDGLTRLYTIYAPALEDLDQACQCRGTGNVASVRSSFLKAIDISGVGEEGGNTMLASRFLAVTQRNTVSYRLDSMGPKIRADSLEEQKPTTTVLLGKVLIDDLITQCFVCKPPTGGVD